MLISVLLLLLVCGTQAGFHGFVFTYTTKTTQEILRVRFSFTTCGEIDTWYCNGVCNNGNIHQIDESVGEWCQKEFIWIWALTRLTLATGMWSGNSWVPNMNGITTWKGLDYEETRNRSDVGKPNSTPQTNVLPAVSVPSNCQKNISLLNFDPDGDVVACRYADGSLSECVNCTPPSVLSLSSSCILSFSPTNSSNEGPYVVQMLMEDFPRQNITLTDSKGGKVVKTTSDAISHTHIQFVFKVLPAVPSCSEGLYLPGFLPPTPQNGAQINATVNQTLTITINAAATQSVITELLFSGPYNMVKNASGSGTFTLTWTPIDSQINDSHSICFVVQANYSSSVYQSEHRCVLVTVGPPPPPTPIHVFYLRMKIITTMSLDNNKELIEKAIKDNFIKRGMPPVISVGLLSSDVVEDTTTPSSG